jgi:hypothetical protein
VKTREEVAAYNKAWREANPERLQVYKERARTDPKRKARARLYLQRDPDLRRRRKLRGRYGLDIAQWDEILAFQNGTCAACDRRPDPSADGRRSWQVDHCHATGRIRGILCAECNLLLGNMGDDAEHVAARCSLLLNYLAQGGDTISAEVRVTMLDVLARMPERLV